MSFFFGFGEIDNDAPYIPRYNTNEIVLERYSSDRFDELERWRDAGKDVGRKLGVIQERQRIIELLREMQETALATKTAKGKQTGVVLENAIVLISLKDKS
jgi:HrpA-like RNA helicase